MSISRGGGVDLTKSQLVAGDRNGVQPGAFLKVGRPDRKMPAFMLSEAQVSEIATFLHSLKPPAPKKEDIEIVGDAKAGEAYFNGAGKCSSCHSVTGNLKGIGSRLSAKVLQARIVLPRGDGGYPWFNDMHNLTAYLVTMR